MVFSHSRLGRTAGLEKVLKVLNIYIEESIVNREIYMITADKLEKFNKRQRSFIILNL